MTSASGQTADHVAVGNRIGIDPLGKVLGAVVFAGGISSIAVETSASRLIAPFFGSSTFIWANLIGLTLLYLTIGYFLGGRIADRWPRPEVLYTITMIAGGSIAFTPFLARPILRLSIDAFDDVNVGVFYGSLLGTILLFAVPITCLGMISPFAVRLRTADVSRAGNTAGSLYALSTVGSILGSLLPAFVLIPLLGTRDSFLVLSLAILIPSMIALLATGKRQQMIFGVAVLLFAIALPLVDQGGLIRPAQYRNSRVIHERESAYNYIQVLERGNEHLLVLNEGHAIHSIYNPDEPLTRGPWDYFMIGNYFQPDTAPEDVESLLMIGLAAGTVSHQFTQVYGPIPIDGVEIDPEIVDVGREYFNMNEPNLNVVVADGRYYLEKTDKQYDVIGIDAYRQPYIPFHLTTKEFFQAVADHLNEDGVAIVNAGRTSEDFRLVEVIAATMDAVFDDVYLIDVEDFNNTMVIGVNGESSVEAFYENIENLPSGSILQAVGRSSIQYGNPRRWSGDAMVFTDDRAPVELVVDQIILEEAQRR
ncbi:MAG TPA: fused MFS/spermidine synthase [Thermomicrobiales bacterium]|nr:fused MFS/spermidine synthase [Thermomicrobiales bacterium]